MDKEKSLAKLLLEMEEKNEGNILSELKFFERLLKEGLQDLLVNPVIPTDKKIGIFEKLTKDQLSVNVKNLITYLIRTKEIEIFPAIVKKFESLMVKSGKTVEVKLVTAKPLSEENFNKIKDKLQTKLNKEPLVTNEVNPDILAGMSVIIGDKVFDNTLDKKIKNLYKELTGAN